MDISIIIVNYNTFDITCNCLASIFNSKTSASFEVILVDNDSKDKAPNLFLERFPNVKLITSKTNLGFGRGNNVGMNTAEGEYFLLINSDTIVYEDTIEKCYRFIESDFSQKNNIGLIGCKLLNPDGSIQPSVFPYIKNNLATLLITTNPLLNFLLRLLGRDKHFLFDFHKTQPVGDISGAFMFLKSEIARATGFFDTDFFMYCEDTEWCRERISKMCAIYYFAEASIIHLGGQSAPQDAMYIQSKLSLSLLWYKKGKINYLFYTLIVYLNCLTMILTLLLMRKRSRLFSMKYIMTYFSILPYLFTEIPRYPKKINSRDKPLIHRKVKFIFSEN